MPEHAASATSMHSTARFFMEILREVAATWLHPGYDRPPPPDSGGDVPDEDYRAGRRSGGRAARGLDRHRELGARGEPADQGGRHRETRIQAAEDGDRDRRRLAFQQPQL